MKLRGIAGTITVALLLAAAILTVDSSRVAAQSTDPLNDGNGLVLGSDISAPQTQLAPDPPLAGSGVVRLSAVAFQPYDQSYTWTRNGTLMLYATGTGSIPFDAPVVLPNGVTINQVVFYFLDNDAGLDASLWWGTLPGNSTTGIASPTISTSGASGLVRYVVMTNFPNPIDNGSNAYLLRVNLPGNAAVALHSVRIDYSYTTTLPLIHK